MIKEAYNSSAKNILITGANRGLGLGLVQEIFKSFNPTQVFATTRSFEDCEDLTKLALEHENLHILQLDLTSNLSINTLCENLKCLLKDEGLQYLINNAGILTKIDQTVVSCKSLHPNIEGETEDNFIDAYRTNVIGPFFLTKNLISLLAKGALQNQKLGYSFIFNMTSFLSSISENTTGGYVSYRPTRAALNMLTKTLSIELKDDKILVICLSPGHVKTRIGGPDAKLEIFESVQGMMNVIKHINEKDNGTHIDYSGKKVPW
ncbi:hypothetical protein HZS_2938 [Henneguya salminicola]|nr:hypothetical protein HZS_2938 [Henneguya salminicola]